MSIQLGSDSAEIEEPHKRGTDRTVMGGDVTIAKGEVVRDLTVFGGNVDIEGEATGDVTVFGGKVHIGTRARACAATPRSSAGRWRSGRARSVDGDVSCVGGELKRDPGATIGGDVSVKGGTRASARAKRRRAPHESEHRGSSGARSNR